VPRAGTLPVRAGIVRAKWPAELQSHRAFAASRVSRASRAREAVM
jgi:hypothetical protein